MKSKHNTANKMILVAILCLGLLFTNATTLTAAALSYIVVDTGQTTCYSENGQQINAPSPGQSLYGQDAQYTGPTMKYKDNGNGTITDLNTGLMWQKIPGAKVAWSQAKAGAAASKLGGYNDWRMPTIKELFSLFKCTGTEPSFFINQTCDTSKLTPFIDTNYFSFTYGNQTTERVIDSQYWSSTVTQKSSSNFANTRTNTPPQPGSLLHQRRMGLTPGAPGFSPSPPFDSNGGAVQPPPNMASAFGVNFADGRIKAYPQQSSHYVIYVRGTPQYGMNNFTSNKNDTVTDKASGLMWVKYDSGYYKNLLNSSACQDGRVDWKEALVFAQKANSVKLGGYSDWRVPNIKELQSIVDYDNAPDYNGKPAIDTRIFTCTKITNEAGQSDYPFYWSSTTQLSLTADSSGRYRAAGREAMYIAFGRGLGYMHNQWVDIHGAGCQRTDPKIYSSTNPKTRGPQGDVCRTYNYVRLVRDAK